MTVLSAYLGLQTAKITQAKERAQANAESKESEVSTLQNRIGELQTENDELRSQLDAPPTGTTSTVEARRFAGEVLVSGSLDLDENPPMNVGSAGGGTSNDIRRLGTSLIVSYFSSVGRWTRQGQPTKAQCADVVASLDLGGGYSFDDVERGPSFCLLTNENHIAFGKVQNVTSDGILLSVVIWDS